MPLEEMDARALVTAAAGTPAAEPWTRPWLPPARRPRPLSRRRRWTRPLPAWPLCGSFQEAPEDEASARTAWEESVELAPVEANDNADKTEGADGPHRSGHPVESPSAQAVRAYYTPAVVL